MTNGSFHRVAMGLGLLSVATATLAAGPAEQRTAQALERIRRIDPKVNAVLAIDPSALVQARRVDRMKMGGHIKWSLPRETGKMAINPDEKPMRARGKKLY